MANILIIEDEASVQMLMKKQVEQAGHTPYLSSTLEDAWARLSEVFFVSLIFLDVRLGKQSGLDFLRKVRPHRLWRDVPVVVTTSVNNREEVLEFIKLGVSGYEIKPLRLEKLELYLKQFEKDWPLEKAFAPFSCVAAGKSLDKIRYFQLLQELVSTWKQTMEDVWEDIKSDRARAALRPLQALRGRAFYIGFNWGVEALDAAVLQLQRAEMSTLVAELEHLKPAPDLIEAYIRQQWRTPDHGATPPPAAVDGEDAPEPESAVEPSPAG